ncbi:ABC transporter permease subunit [Amycolatopsis sp.]|uniref:branched-chain amino acid ABC transporter ATP-binding protein/permease n=1 Tax=Amycolatopsis sp. TaxID=37632 RepID=UPI002D7FC484|nr:ATP-binding cassette domain-containing protein [Amycolatopsis sp.]HET6707557.1 ATP-binding cassette domain-containing protein [Amycolatopsis sp.]
MRKVLAGTALAVLLAAAPFGLGAFTLAILTLGLAYGLFAFGLDLAWGRAGMLSVGHAAFFGLGAYAVAIGQDHGWPPVLALAPAIVVSVVIALLVAGIGLASAVPDAPLILLTLGIGLLLQKAATGFTAVTGGSNGMSVSDTGVVTGYYRTLVVAAVLVALCVRLLRSRFGAQLVAAARNPERAEQTGIDTKRVRTIAFAVSATVSTVAGALYAPVAGLVSPPVFGLALSTSVLVWLAVGGRESVLGPFLAAVVLTAGQQLLGSSWQSWYVLGLAAVFVFVVQVLPGGIAGTARAWLRRGKPAVTLPRAKPRPRPVPPSDDPALVLQGVSKSFGPVSVLDGVDLVVPPGRCVCLIGPNGAGKSTLLAIVAGQLAADAGSLRLFGRDVSAVPVHDRVRLGVGRMFQIPSVIGELSPADNIRLARLGAPAEVELPAEYRDLAADEDTVASTLALADRRRLELAMVLAGAPRLVLLDEPAAGLGPDDARQLVRALRDVIAHTGCAMLVVEHDMEIVRGLADDVAALHRGRVIAHGSMDEIVADAAVRQAYLGAS